MRAEALALLQEDYQLQRIVKLLGEEALPDAQRLTLEAARWLKQGFLQQSAYDPLDMYCSPQRQMKMLHLILGAYRQARRVLAQGIPFYQIRTLEELADLLKMKSLGGEDQLEQFEALAATLSARLEALVTHGSA
jgi:V/A-type H+-transporting ATPase subunit A